MKRDTRIVHSGRHPQDHHGVVNPPVYHASTILQPDLASLKASRQPGWKGYRYGRAGTPTTRGFAEAVADMYGCDYSVAVSSGLAAITCAVMACVKTGDHVLMVDSAYFPARKFAEGFLKRFGVKTTYYNASLGADIESLMQENTTVVYTESPGSLTFEMMDVPAVAEVAHRHGARVIFDNTWATAVYFDALNKGVDIVVEAVTKYIGGHSDIMMGAIIANEACAADVQAMVGLQGQCGAPDDVYLAQRGLRTLSIRLQRCGENGLALAKWLQGRPEVARVCHPALPDDPGHALWKRDFEGSSGLFSFILNDYPETAVAAFVDGLVLYGMGASWGGFESLILPSDPSAMRTSTPWTETGRLMRIHAGLEDIEDLIADLEAGFERLGAVAEAAA